MACGCPVVSTDCPGGSREILKDGRYGRLVEVGDAEGLAVALGATLQNPPAGSELMDRARDYPFEPMVTRRLYAVEAWLAIVGLSIYLAITEIGPRLARERGETATK